MLLKLEMEEGDGIDEEMKEASQLLKGPNSFGSKKENIKLL